MPGYFYVLRLMALQFVRVFNGQNFIVFRHDYHFGPFFDALPVAFTVFFELFSRRVLVSSQGIRGFGIGFLQGSALRVCYIAFDSSLIRS